MTDRRPAAVVAVVAAGLAAVAVAAVPVAALLALAGGAALAAGTLAGLRRVVDGGAVVLAAAVALAGLGGVGAATLAVGTVAALLAWDGGRTAVDVAGTFGDGADSTRAQLGHLGATTLALGGAGTVALLAATLGPAGRPVGALVVLGVGVALVGAALALD